MLEVPGDSVAQETRMSREIDVQRSLGGRV
jgi:hypothetical protein